MKKTLFFAIPILVLFLVGIFGWLGYAYKNTVVAPDKKEVLLLSPNEEQVVSGGASISPESFEALFNKDYSSEALEVGETLEENTTYTKSAVTYKSGDFTISGVLYVPKATPPKGGFPVVITNHGYIDPAVYTTGRGLKREQNYFVSNGFVVLHPDYRNHAGSTKSDEDAIKMRLGYIEDIINAVLALKASTLSINKEKIAMLGHSMGGGATLASVIVKPDLVQKVVLYAPVSLNYQDSYERYMNDDVVRKEKVISMYQTPEANPTFWEGLNGEPYINRLQIQVRIYHGTSDDDVPLAWSERTKQLLDSAGKQSELVVYPGEEHEFGPRWTDFMSSSKDFIQTP